MGDIRDRINRLRADVNEVALAWPLEHIDLDVISEIERREQANRQFAPFADNLRKKLAEAETANVYERTSVIFDGFAEARAAILLLDHGAQFVERIPEFDFCTLSGQGGRVFQ